jgi:flagellar hook-basal body complex protein FliE
VNPVNPLAALTGPAGIGNLPDSEHLTLPGAGPASGATGTAPATRPGGVAGPSFAQALDRVAAAEQKADTLALALATGQLENVHDFTLAAAEANLAVQMTTAYRNRALEAFTEVMRMQL